MAEPDEIRQVERKQQYAANAADARLLLDWALKEMPHMDTENEAKPVSIPETILDAIAHSEHQIYLGDDLGPQDIVRLDEALGALSRITMPVSVNTLRHTDSNDTGRSLARKFSKKLYWIAGITVFAVIATEVILDYSSAFWPTADAEDSYSFGWYLALLSLERLEPFIYGALGALAYLLRTAKHFITARSFDVYRIPEYYARLLLGIVSGGAAALLAASVSTDTVVIELSKGVVGFLAGYSTEFLYRLVERLLEALLPRVDISSMRTARRGLLETTNRAMPASVLSDLTKSLMDRLGSAKDPDERKQILEMLGALKNRIGSE